MKNLLLIVVASAALVACQKETIVQGGNDPAPVDVSNVVLPPSITASKTYRCKDNSVVYIDWLSDNLSANFRPDQNATPVQLKAAEVGKPLTAEGYSLTGDAKAANVTLMRPGKGTESCKA